ncbi:hypothetical protein V1477_013731 [Vespula maculifrons]|uniref:Uncharacterized protein n=1 Tax=Vespula maculifrons TaxID=7453 RepID=A0ABD2BP60_VESMC
MVEEFCDMIASKSPSASQPKPIPFFTPIDILTLTAMLFTSIASQINVHRLICYLTNVVSNLVTNVEVPRLCAFHFRVKKFVLSSSMEGRDEILLSACGQLSFKFVNTMLLSSLKFDDIQNGGCIITIYGNMLKMLNKTMEPELRREKSNESRGVGFDTMNKRIMFKYE